MWKFVSMLLACSSLSLAQEKNWPKIFAEHSQAQVKLWTKICEAKKQRPAEHRRELVALLSRIAETSDQHLQETLSKLSGKEAAHRWTKKWRHILKTTILHKQLPTCPVLEEYLIDVVFELLHLIEPLERVPPTLDWFAVMSTLILSAEVLEQQLAPLKRLPGKDGPRNLARLAFLYEGWTGDDFSVAPRNLGGALFFKGRVGEAARALMSSHRASARKGFPAKGPNEELGLVRLELKIDKKLKLPQPQTRALDMTATRLVSVMLSRWDRKDPKEFEARRDHFEYFFGAEAPTEKRRWIPVEVDLSDLTADFVVRAGEWN